MLDPETAVGDAGERALVAHLRARIPGEGSGVELGVGDDAAVVHTGALTLVTTDCLVEGVHFRSEWAPARLLGRKALTVNLADIAAMAGVPRYATVSLCLPPELKLGFLDSLYDGLLERGAETGVSIVGGNLSRISGSLVVDITLIGSGDRIVRRSGAVPGDLAVVTGHLGAASVGLRLLAQGARLDAEGELETTGIWTKSSAEAVTHCLRAQLDPTPPLALARALSEQDLVHAAMDLSDGLSGDIQKLCEESGVTSILDLKAVPIDTHAAALERARGGDPLAAALHGGEDYEFLFAIPGDRLDGLKDLAVVWDLKLTVIGEFTEGPATVSVKDGDALKPLEMRAHDHFKGRGPVKPA